MKSTRTRSRWALLASIALGGGTVFGSCETRFKEAAFDGLESFVLSPNRVVDVFTLLGLDDLNGTDPQE